MVINLNIPYLDKNVLNNKADSFLKKFWKDKKLPLDIEIIVEKELGIDIIPVDLRCFGDIVAFSNFERNSIWVDNFVMEKRETRFRFSLAHEVGHFYLHKKYYQNLSINSIEHWFDVCNKLNRKDLGKAEFQANYFAASVLIPKNNLMEDLKRFIKHKNYNPENIYLAEELAIELSPKYNVSTGCMSRRINEIKKNI